MARRRKLTFTVSTTLLTGGLVATSALAGACDERDVAVNPAYDVTADAEVDGDDDYDFEVSVNPVPDTSDVPGDYEPDYDEDFEVSVNPVPDTTDTSIEDEEWVSVNPCYDDDGDGYYGGGFCAVEDCNDFDPSIHPGAMELCDGIDNDCDGDIDEDVVDPNGECKPDPMCVDDGALCSLDGQSTCCSTESYCMDIGQDAPEGHGVCCVPDGLPYTGVPGDGQACCTKDLDGDGLCGDAAP